MRQDVSYQHFYLTFIWRYQQGQKVKRGVAGIKNGREEKRLSLSIGNMIVCIEYQNNL